MKLRILHWRCGFTDEKLEIKLQFVFGCISRRVRRKGLSEEMDLERLLKFARAIELSDKQSDTIEEQKPSYDTINKINRAGKYSKLHQPKVEIQKKRCFSCGGIFPHVGGRESCPAYDRRCNRCNKKNHFAQYCKTKDLEAN